MFRSLDMNLVSYIYGCESVEKFAYSKPNTFIHLRDTTFRRQDCLGSCPPEPQGRAQTKKGTETTQEGATPLLGMIEAHGAGREASHSIFGSKSSAPGHEVMYHTLDNQGLS